jgi:hypothetical protein
VIASGREEPLPSRRLSAREGWKPVIRTNPRWRAVPLSDKSKFTASHHFTGRDRGDSGMATNAFIELNLAEAKKLADYTSIEYDLRTAREFAATMVSEYQKTSPNYSLCDPFMVAAIIRYARAFSAGVRLKLYEEGESTLTDEQRSKHSYFMGIRDKYIAHSVNAFEENQPVARYWVERVQEEGITSIECNHRRISGLSEQEFKDIIDLASTWLRYVQR